MKPRARAPVEACAEVRRSRLDVRTTSVAVAALRDSLRDLEPVRVRQEDVQQHELRPQRLRRRERRGPVPGLADDPEAACFEQPAGEATEARVVVDDQHRLRHERIVSFSTAIGNQGYPESSAAEPIRGSHRCGLGRHRPSVGGMNSNHLLRIGAAAAFLGVIAQLAAAMLEPERVGDTDKAIRTIAESEAWTGRWLVHLAGIVLLVTALAVVTRTFSEGPAKEWARVGQPLFVVAGALGVAEVLVGASTKDLADGWAAAAPGDEPAVPGRLRGRVERDRGPRLRRAARAAGSTSRRSRPRSWPGTSTRAGSAGPPRSPLRSWLVGIVLELRSPVGTALVVVGNVLFFVVLIGLGVVDVARRWRTGAADEPRCRQHLD